MEKESKSTLAATEILDRLINQRIWPASSHWEQAVSIIHLARTIEKHTKVDDLEKRLLKIQDVAGDWELDDAIDDYVKANLEIPKERMEEFEGLDGLADVVRVVFQRLDELEGK